MWSVSPEYLAQIMQPVRRWKTRVDVLYANNVVTTLNVVLEGNVAIDNVAVRRSLDITMSDPEGRLTPTAAQDLLAPKGTEIRPYRGLELPDGSYEWVPLGVFGVVEPVIDSHSPGTKIKIKAWDRVDTLRKRRFITPYAVAGGTNTADVIADIVTSRLDVPVRITKSQHTTPEVVFDNLTDPWDAIKELAEADGLSVYFDASGILVIEPETDQITGIVYGSDGVLLDCSREMSSERTYNGVLVSGEHPETGSIRSQLWDTDPASPTYRYGPFGERPYGFYSKLVDTQEKADKSAETIFRRVVKMRQLLTIHTAGVVGHEINDVIYISDVASRTEGYYRIRGATIPLRGTKIRLRCEELDD